MDGFEKSLPLAEGMVDAEQEARVRDGGPRNCLNCDTPLTDKFCPHCGQKDIPRRQTMGELISNFIGSFTSFESKFFRSLKYLLLHPGFLPLEYTAGRRERYYHPARAYVFISFIFFLLFVSLPDDDDGGDSGDDVKTTESVITANQDDDDENSDNNNTRFKLDSTDYKTRAQYDSIQSTLPEADRDGWIKRMAQYRAIDLNNKYEGKKGEFSKDFAELFTANAPKVFFFLLPIFALILKLLYVRRDFFYSEHLVFTTNYYNFFYLAGSIVMLIGLIPYVGWIKYFLVVWMVIYPLIGMKRMYNQGWFKTVVKFGMLWFIFGFFVSLALVVDVFIIMLTL